MQDASLNSTVLERLHQQGRTIPDLANQLGCSAETVASFMDGKVPLDINLIRRMGQVLGIDTEVWAGLVAGLAGRCLPRDIARYPHAMIWFHLVKRGIEINELNIRYNLGSRVITAMMRHGRISRTVHSTSLFADFKITTPIQSDRQGSAVLMDLLTRHIQASHKNFGQIAEGCGITEKTLREMMRHGYPPPKVLPSLAKDLSRQLSLHFTEVVEALADAHDPSAHRNSVGYHLAFWIYTHMRGPADLARAAEVKEAVISRCLLGELSSDPQALEKLRNAMGVDHAIWARAIERTAPRQQMPSAEMNRMRGRVRSLQDMIQDAADEEDLSPVKWGAKNGINRFRIHAIMNEGKVPTRAIIRVPLCQALRIDRPSFDAACRLMMAKPRIAPKIYADVVPICEVQDSLLNLLRSTKATIISLAKAYDVPEDELRMLARVGRMFRDQDYINQLAKMLGTTPTSVIDGLRIGLAEQEDDISVDKDAEVRLLALVRRMDPVNQSKLIDVAIQMLNQPSSRTTHH